MSMKIAIVTLGLLALVVLSTAKALPHPKTEDAAKPVAVVEKVEEVASAEERFRREPLPYVQTEVEDADEGERFKRAEVPFPYADEVEEEARYKREPAPNPYPIPYPAPYPTYDDGYPRAAVPYGPYYAQYGGGY